MERHHMLGESATLTAWLERKRRHWLLISGTKWKRGYWVLDTHKQTIIEYHDGDRTQQSYEINPLMIDRVQKSGLDEIHILMNNNKDVILKTPDESTRTRWVDALADVLFQLSERHQSTRPKSTSRGKSLRVLVHKSFRSSRKLTTDSISQSTRPYSDSAASSAVDAFNMERNPLRDASMGTSGGQLTRDAESLSFRGEPLVQDADEDRPKKRQVVIPVKEPERTEESIDASRFHKTLKQRQKLIQLLETEFKSFASGTLLNDIDSRAVVDLMYKVEITKDTPIVAQGDPADRMFVIETGTIGVYSQDVIDQPAHLETEKKESEIVGMLSLLYNQPAPFTLKTHSDCQLWALPSKKFHELSTNEVKRKLWKKVTLLENVPLIVQNIDESLLTQLADSMVYRDYEPGQVLVKSGEEFTQLVVVAEGEAVLRDSNGTVLGKLTKGDVFGEWALLEVQAKSDTTLAASTPLQVLILERSQVEEVVGPLRKVLLERWLEVCEGKELTVESAAAVVSNVGQQHGLVMDTLEEDDDAEMGADEGAMLEHSGSHMSQRGGVLTEMLHPLKEVAAIVLGKSHHELPHVSSSSEVKVQAEALSRSLQQLSNSSERLLHPGQSSEKLVRGLHDSHHQFAQSGDRLVHHHQHHDANSNDSSNRSLKEQHPHAVDSSHLPLLHLPSLPSPIHKHDAGGNTAGGIKTSERSMRSVATRSSRTGARSSRTAGRSSRTAGRSSRTIRSDRSMMSVEERRRRASMMAAAMTVITKEQEDAAMAQMMETLKQRENFFHPMEAVVATPLSPTAAAAGTRSLLDAVSSQVSGLSLQPHASTATISDDDATLVIKPETPSIVERQQQDFVSGESLYGTEDQQRIVQETPFGNLDKPFERCVPLRPDLVMEAIELCAQLGKGSFGKVHLARNKKRPEEVFALKVLAKYTIVKYGWERMVEYERDAMNELTTISQSPFIVKLWNSFSDRKNVYLLLEVCEAGDLFRIMKKQTKHGKFSEHQTMFYMGCVVLGLEAMHSLDIVYRDLKPENLMMTRNGYVKLADFGLAKKTLRTFTVCGTPEYMAPETLLSQGHNHAVDWWAAGVMMYELIHGETPFGVGETTDVYEAILDHELMESLKFPDPVRTMFSTNAKDLIRNLIHPRKNKRLGVKYPGVDGVKQHPFFRDLNWTLLEKLGLSAPFIPNVAEVLKYAKQKTIKYDAQLNAGPDDRSGWTLPF